VLPLNTVPVFASYSSCRSCRISASAFCELLMNDGIT
jgi:hypothetical protein